MIGTFERAAQQRSVQLVTIVGEPGVGKSRLVAELFAYLETKPELTRWRQGRCLPYGEGITFWALGEIVKAEAGILESDSAEVAAAKLEAAVSPEEPERRWLLQRLAPLVGVEAASPAERQELFTAWRRFLEGLAAARPSVLVFEDLHWADEALLAFLEHLAEWAEGVPLLVLCTARPELYERHPGWAGGMRNATTINLPPLSDRGDGRARLPPDHDHRAQRRSWSRACSSGRAATRSYAEEFVRLLADREPGAPASRSCRRVVQALIAARLDTLSPERKSLLQDAAVLGKVFWVGALAEIGGRDQGELELALHELARKELVRPARVSSMEGESEYSFWHLLVRDVAYGQIPRAERARRHRAAAAWIERKAGERVEDLAEVLAHHYLQALELAEAAGDTEQAEELALPARRFLALAGERALGLDTAQAEARLARALELCPADDPERPELLSAGRTPPSRPAARARPRPRSTRRSTCFRARGETEAEARALILLARVTPRTGRGPTGRARRRGRRPARAGASRSDARRRLHAARRGALPRRRLWRGDRSRRPGAARSPRRSACPSRPGRSAFAATPAPTAAIRTASPRWNGLSPCSSSRAKATKRQVSRTTLRSPAIHSRGPPARWPTSSRGSPSASSAA